MPTYYEMSLDLTIGEITMQTTNNKLESSEHVSLLLLAHSGARGESDLQEVELELAFPFPSIKLDCVSFS